MKLLNSTVAALTLSLASLSAVAMMGTDLLGEPAQAPSAERAILTAVADRAIAINDTTKWVNVTHYEVIQFVSNGRDFTWAFDGVAQPGAFDLRKIAPQDFLDHGVTVYVAMSERDFNN